MTIITRLFFILFICQASFSFTKEQVFDSIFGKINISEPLILDIIDSPYVQRMKDIDQHGLVYFTKDHRTFNRYDHSLGVYYILKRFNLPLIEQAAGLTHDISHTTFSHIGDLVYEHYDDILSYQDSIHFWYLKKTDLPKILEKYDYNVEDFLFKNDRYQGLEQNLPDLCADRIEYNLHTGFVYNFISQDEIEEILTDLHYENGRWYFETPSIAKKFAALSLYFTENFWGVNKEAIIYKFAANAFKRAMNLKVISFDQLHFSTDSAVLESMKKSDDPLIKGYLKRCNNPEKYYSKGNRYRHNYSVYQKFRGVNPWVKVEDSFIRLTSLDMDFAVEYLRVKELIQNGSFFQIDLGI
ncbi:MAG: hypothetical protein S4CHLAM37_16800 [Chlamydiia bacterium]|nr:hypothetical protein [Chlamydiia bacterium]